MVGSWRPRYFSWRQVTNGCQWGRCREWEGYIKKRNLGVLRTAEPVHCEDDAVQPIKVRQRPPEIFPIPVKDGKTLKETKNRSHDELGGVGAVTREGRSSLQLVVEP
jgi:hypothetical protein